MTNQDVIKNMEDVWGMKKGYDKNPVAVQKFNEVVERLKKAGITELTPQNKDVFERITGEYITDRNYKTGTKFGWSNKRPDDPNSSVVSSDYKMDIDKDGNLIEEGKVVTTSTYTGKKITITESTKNEYNKHGLGMKSEKKVHKIDSRLVEDERKTIVTRNPDLITAKVETMRHTNKDSWNRKPEDNITCELRLNTPYDGHHIKGNASNYIDRKTLEVYDDSNLHEHMEQVRDNHECDYSLEAFEKKMVIRGKPGYADYDKLVHTDYKRTPDFDLTYSKDDAFRETAKDMGLRPDLEKRVKTNKIKEIYDKIKDKIKNVAEKFTKRTKDDKTQNMKY